MTLPNDEERKKIAYLLHEVFVELRYLEGEQSQDLAYAFHNIPLEMYGTRNWDTESIKQRLRYYQNKHKGKIGTDFLQIFTSIYPD